MGPNLQKMPESFDQIKKQYLNIAFQVMDKVSEQKEFTANHHLHMQISGIKSRFIEKHEEYFSNILLPAQSSEPHKFFEKIKRSFHDLALVEYEDLNFQLIRRQFSNKIYDALGTDLALVTLRFEEILGHELELNKMPLSPNKFSKALQHALKPTEMDTKQKELFYKQLLTLFAKNYSQCLNSANNTFIDKGILVDLNESDGISYFQRKQNKHSAKKKRKELMASISLESMHDENGNFVTDNMEDLLEQIDIPQKQQEHILTATPLSPDATQKQLLDAISELQNSLTPSLNDDYLSPKSHLSLAKKLEKDTSIKNYNLNKSDANSISMMSMLFDNLLENKHISKPIKALLEQLQAPLLRTALLDKHFFADSGNPAQALVDMIAEQNAGWIQNKDPSKDFLYKKMSDIVRKVNSDFDDSYAVFDEVLNEFKHFNKNHQARVNKLETRIVTAEKAKARFGRAKETAKQHYSQTFSEYVLGDEMTDFFNQHWQLVLFYIHNKYDNQNNQEWHKAINTENLLKLNLEGNIKADKRKTVAALQKMMLDTGQTQMDVKAGLQKIIPFIKRTSRASSHSNANTDYNNTNNTHKPASITALHKTAKNVAEQLTTPVNVVTNKAIKNEPLKPTATEEPHSSAELTPSQLQQLHEQLTVGSWLSEGINTITEKVKIAAYIKHTDTYILIRRNGTKFASLNSAEMSDQLTQKTLTLLESSMMFDKALESVIHSIRAA